MTISTSPKSYEDCFSLLDQALGSSFGIRQGFPKRSQAMTMVTRLNRARQIDRDRNREVYTPDNPNHGTSKFDTLIIRAPRDEGGKWWVYIEPRIVLGEVEKLGAAE